MGDFSVKTAVSTDKNEKKVVAEVLEKIKQENMKCVIFFVSSSYDQRIISKCINNYCSENKAYIDVEFIGCTSSGEITPDGVRSKSFTAMSIAGKNVEIGVGVCKRLSYNPIGSGKHGVEKACFQLGIKTEDINSKNYVGLVLVDGLQKSEEYLMLGMSKAARLLKIAGGSAGDDYNFKKAYIHARRNVYEDAAVILIIKTDTPFKIMQASSYIPTEKKLKVTSADIEERLVYKFNNKPAAEEYSKLLGISVQELNRDTFMSYPIAINVGDSYFVRSPLKVEENGALRFFCQVLEGSTVTLMRPGEMVDEVKDIISKAKSDLGDIGAVIAFNCILRYHKLLKLGNLKESFEALQTLPVIGFNTYGEQYNGLHINQTLTLLIFGK